MGIHTTRSHDFKIFISTVRCQNIFQYKYFAGPGSVQYSTISSSKPNIVGPIVVISLLFLSYISGSAALLSKLHSWTFVQSFHFCFMSLLTVSTGSARLDTDNVLPCSIFIFVGLVLISTSGHIIYNEVVVKMKQGTAALPGRRLLTTNHSEKSQLGSSHDNLTDRKRNNVFS